MILNCELLMRTLEPLIKVPRPTDEKPPPELPIKKVFSLNYFLI
jgi:hypothetical protein